MASMQWAEEQSAASWQAGAASPAVTQKPPAPQTTASPQLQQSADVAQPVRQLPFTHICAPLQSVFARQLGRGRSSARHSPATQRSSGPQSASAWQPPWQ
jgi:hypothetical protein